MEIDLVVISTKLLLYDKVNQLQMLKLYVVLLRMNELKIIKTVHELIISFYHCLFCFNCIQFYVFLKIPTDL